MMTPILRTAVCTLLFTLATAAYNQDVGLSAMHYAASAYCSKETLVNWQCGEACNFQKDIEANKMIIMENEVLDTFGFVAYNSEQNKIIVSFRGTNGADITNWITNIVYYRVQYFEVAGSQVHSGFFTAYRAISYQMLEGVRTLFAAHPSADIVLTGHSLGAALATFAALDIKRSIPTFKNQFTFYTFGSPRIGNQVFADYVMTLFPNLYSRVVHYTDLVAHMPPKDMGFAHSGNEVYYT